MPKGKATPLTLAADERAELEKLVRRRKTAQDLALRARIVEGFTRLTLGPS